MTQAEVRRVSAVWLPVVGGVAGTVIAIWGLHATAGLLGPILLAFVLTVTVHPLPGWLGRKGVPRGLAVFLSVVAADGILIGLALAVVVSLGQLVTVLPQYSAEWADLVDGLRSTLVNLGVGPDEARAALSSIDFFTVPTVTGPVLFVFVVLLHHRRRIVHFNVTEHPTAVWTAQQVVEAFPDDTTPRWSSVDS